MSSPTPGPTGPPTGPETFTSQSDLGSYMRRMLPLLAVMVLLAWLIATLLLNAVGVPLPALVGLLPALALGAYGYTFQKKRHEEVHAAAQLIFSAQGVELVDAHTRVSLAWGDATRVGPGDMMGPLNLTLSDNAAVQATSAAARATTRRSQDTLWGVGSMTVAPDAPALVRATVDQQLGGRDPRRTEVGTPLTVFDPAWRQGRIGGWIATYRPDLLG